MIRFLFRTVLVVLILYGIGYAARDAAAAAGRQRTDAIVATGGSGRLERGFDLVERGISRRMMISGVNRTVRPNELAEAYDVEPRLLDCCVVLERESFDTSLQRRRGRPLGGPAPHPLDPPGHQRGVHVAGPLRAAQASARI